MTISCWSPPSCPKRSEAHSPCLQSYHIRLLHGPKTEGSQVYRSHHNKATPQAGNEQGRNSPFSYYISLCWSIVITSGKAPLKLSYNCTDLLSKKKKVTLFSARWKDSTPKKFYQEHVLSSRSIPMIIQQNFRQIIQILRTDLRLNPSTNDNLKNFASVFHMGNSTFTGTLFMTFYSVKRANMSLWKLFFFF